MPIAQTTLRIGTDKATVISDLDYDYLTLKNGNVGIGTKNPLEKLHIKTSPASYRHGVLIDVENPFSNAGPALRLAGTGTYTTPTTLEIRRLDTENKEISFSLMNNAYNNGFKIKMPPNSNDVYFDLFGLGGDGEIIIKRDTGYVGIGTYTSNPTAKLDINGQIRIRGGGPGPNKVLTSDAAGLASWQPGGAGGGIGGSGIDNYIPRWLGTNSLENSVIYQTDAGNVGIGTTNPLGMLGIDGFSTTTGPPGSVLSDHPVGITMLNTSNAIGSYTSITNARNDYGPLGINVVRSGIFFRTMDQLYAGQIDFYTYDGLWTEGEGVRMSIDRKGYVGIGTESPDAVLEIVSDLGYFGADYLADSTLRLKKEKGVAGSVELFPAVGSSGAPKYNGLQICRTVSSSVICLGAWRSPIQGGGNIVLTLSEAGVRALCADFGD